ncbi:MAG: XisI protein [Symploca sp. SIO1A3]|nr:XisI protein [Symploca sp. SIO1A3]
MPCTEDGIATDLLQAGVPREDTALRAVTRYSKIDDEKIYQILITYSGVPHCSGKRCIVLAFHPPRLRQFTEFAAV